LTSSILTVFTIYIVCISPHQNILIKDFIVHVTIVHVVLNKFDHYFLATFCDIYTIGHDAQTNAGHVLVDVNTEVQQQEYDGT
jgi:hypothetical protein